MWQHVKLSEQICPWDTLACCWDVKQPTNKQLLLFSFSPSPLTHISFFLRFLSLSVSFFVFPPPPPSSLSLCFVEWWSVALKFGSLYVLKETLKCPVPHHTTTSCVGFRWRTSWFTLLCLSTSWRKWEFAFHPLSIIRNTFNKSNFKTKWSQFLFSPYRNWFSSLNLLPLTLGS